MEKAELDTILAAHTAWLRGDGGRRANLTGADLTGTCLSPSLRELARAFTRACPADVDGRRVVYRTSTSRVGNKHYEPGQSYDAPYLSWDAATECHPGIYAASLAWMLENYRGAPLVRCYVYDGDWTITAKGAIRTAHLEVIEYVDMEKAA